jgi:hypothetical protein
MARRCSQVTNRVQQTCGVFLRFRLRLLRQLRSALDQKPIDELVRQRVGYGCSRFRPDARRHLREDSSSNGNNDIDAWE